MIAYAEGMSTKTVTSSRPVKRAAAPRAAATSASRRSTAGRSSLALSRKKVVQVAKVAAAVPLAKRALKKVKTKAGLAVLTGVALAVAGGLVRKYRKAS